MPAASPSPPLIRAAIIGVTGRMGQALLRAAPGFPQLIVTGALASPASLGLGRDAGQIAGIGPLNLLVTSDVRGALAQADVVLDFSTPAATLANLAACRAAKKPLLIGTTGFGEHPSGELEAAARDIAVLVAANTSVAVALLAELTARAAGALRGFDVNILEVHHRLKRDAPSGTALALAAAAREGREALDGPTDAAPAGGRAPGKIGIASVRAGDIVGEHTVLFSGSGEQLCLTHRATDRAIFARGALTAALWLASRPPGRYGMGDLVLSKTEA
jgi:4-hydroxy-tetrahydrodipicolinate reductase